jgi:hypothetical protein
MSRQPSNGQIIGIALLIFASVLIGESMHHLVATGTCSSTGYTRYGPAPTCPAGTAFWIIFIPVGVFAVLGGALISGNGGLIIPGIFTGIGVGSLSVAFDASASGGTKAAASRSPGSASAWPF